MYEVFREIPNRAMYNQVQVQYHALYDKELNYDLEDELTADEYNTAMRILNENERASGRK